MNQFPEPLVVTPLLDGESWVIYKDFSYDVGSEDSGDRIHVDLGFVTDFASIPRILWVFFPKWGVYGNASVIHDWLYWSQTRSRKESDEVMLEAMQVLEVKAYKRQLIFIAIRLFGAWAWNRNKWDQEAGLDRVIHQHKSNYSKKSKRPGILERTFEQIKPSDKQSI